MSAIGESVEESVASIQNNCYEPVRLEGGAKYYKIPNIKQSDYYKTIEKVVVDAVKSAGLSEQALKESALFLGTSSVKLPLNEIHAKESAELLKDLCMGEVVDIISQRTGIGGFKTVISTACTSSSNALIQAREMIETGLIDRAVVVGVELYNELSINGFDSFMLLSDNKIKPFDKERDGIILGEAVSAVVLSRVKSSFALVGGAIKVDTASITAPTPEDLAAVMREALESANIQTKDVKLIKTHSTGTRQNDEAEAKGIYSLFCSHIPKILTLKPYLGHTMGACGTNELAFLLESLKQGSIPKSIHFENIDSECMIEPCLEERAAEKGYYLLNYFGFGGNNSSFVLKYDGE